MQKMEPILHLMYFLLFRTLKTNKEYSVERKLHQIKWVTMRENHAQKEEYELRDALHCMIHVVSCCVKKK